jgi:hypothetical protein
MIATMADRLGDEERRFWWQEQRNLKVTDGKRLPFRGLS